MLPGGSFGLYGAMWLVSRVVIMSCLLQEPCSITISCQTSKMPFCGLFLFVITIICGMLMTWQALEYFSLHSIL